MNSYKHLKNVLNYIINKMAESSSASAFVQARIKIKVAAFKILFNHFNKKTHVDKLYKGYKLLPIDNTVHDKETMLLVLINTIPPIT